MGGLLFLMFLKLRVTLASLSTPYPQDLIAHLKKIAQAHIGKACEEIYAETCSSLHVSLPLC